MFSTEYDEIARHLNPRCFFDPLQICMDLRNHVTNTNILTHTNFLTNAKYDEPTLPTPPTSKFDPRHPRTHATYASHAI